MFSVNLFSFFCNCLTAIELQPERSLANIFIIKNQVELLSVLSEDAAHNLIPDYLT